MGFKNEYTSKQVKREDENKLPGERSNILPFFGYSYELCHHTKRWTVDTGYRITEKYGSYDVKKNPDIYDSSFHSYVRFYRNRKPGEKLQNLEDRIYPLLKKKYSSNKSKYFNYFETETPYLKTSCSEYYDDNVGFVKTTFNIFVVATILCVIALIILIFKGLWSLILWPIGIFLITFFIVELVDKIFLKRHSFESLSETEKEEWVQKYLNSLTIHDEECDKLLREYAILKGYHKR